MCFTTALQSIKKYIEYGRKIAHVGKYTAALIRANVSAVCGESQFQRVIRGSRQIL